jgi:CspA family cold shock protein
LRRGSDRCYLPRVRAEIDLGEAVLAPVVVAEEHLRDAALDIGGNAMATGTVKWFSDDKGFGFVTPDEAGKDLFVHHSGIAGEGFRSLTEGARVSYDAEAGDKGPKAVNVRPID